MENTGNEKQYETGAGHRSSGSFSHLFFIRSYSDILNDDSIRMEEFVEETKFDSGGIKYKSVTNDEIEEYIKKGYKLSDIV